MGNSVIGVRNYVIVKPLQLGNFLIADLHRLVLLRELAARGTVSAIAEALHYLAGDVWVTGEAGTGLGEMATQICAAAGGFTPDVRYVSNDVAVMEGLVSGGHAVALVPNLARAATHPDVVVRHLHPGPFGRDIFVAVRPTSANRATLHVFTSAIQDALAH